MLISDYLSIWEVAHRWHGIDPNKTSPHELPMHVQDTLRYLCRAILNGELQLYVPDAIQPVDRDQNFVLPEIRYYVVYECPSELQSCAFSRQYDQPVLDQFVISRHDLFKRSIYGNEEFPVFWEDDQLITEMGGVVTETELNEQNPPRPNSSLFDQSLCQAIARTLWDIHPAMTIEAMTKHPAIQKFGNGAIYKGKNTLRDWLSPVAPEHVKKPGRPKKSKTSNDAP